MPNKADDVTARLTDTSKYTGAHKERFNKDGTGKGQAGRKDLFNNTGSTSSNTRDNTIQDVTIEKKGAVVNPVDNFGSTAKKVLWFEYAKKNDQGEKFVLTKQKFPTMKQISAATVKFTPPGKPKQIYDKNLKEVKTLEEFEDGGKYLVMTAFDKQKLDETKIPTAFRD